MKRGSSACIYDCVSRTTCTYLVLSLSRPDLVELPVDLLRWEMMCGGDKDTSHDTHTACSCI
jgi:hypothetical protein